MSPPPAPARPGPLRGSLAAMIGEGLSLPTGLVTIAILTRVLGPVGYGRFSVAATLVVTLEWLLVAIFARVTVKFVAEADDWRPVAATSFRAYVISGTALGATLWLLADWIANLLGDPLMSGLLRVFALEIPVFAAAAASRNVLVGLASYREQALVAASRWLGRMTLIALFVYIGWSVTGAILGSIGGALIAWILGQAFVGRASWGRAGFPYRQLMGLAVPAFLLMLSVRLFDRVGLLMLKALGDSDVEVGFYGATQNLAMIAGIVAMTTTPILISTLTAARRDGNKARAREAASNSIRAALGVLPFAAIVAGSSEEVVELLFGGTFIEAAPLAAWMMLVAETLIVISVATALLIARGRLWRTVLLTAPLLPLSILGHALLIPRYGAVGAAGVTAATGALAAAACVLAAILVWDLRLPVGTLLRSLILAGVAYVAASAWPAPGFLLFVEGTVLSLLVLAGYVLSGELSRDELARIRALLSAEWRRLRSARG
jgi:O-antigen/teichoic acid export membrane protein